MKLYKIIVLPILLFTFLSCATGTRVAPPESEYIINEKFTISIEKIVCGKKSVQTVPNEYGNYTKYTPKKKGTAFTEINIEAKYTKNSITRNLPEIEIFYKDDLTGHYFYSQEGLRNCLSRNGESADDLDEILAGLQIQSDGQIVETDVEERWQMLFVLPVKAQIMAISFDRKEHIDIVSSDSPLFSEYNSEIEICRKQDELFRSLPVISYEQLSALAVDCNLDYKESRDSRGFNIYQDAVIFGNLSVVKGLIEDNKVEREFTADGGMEGTLVEMNLAVLSGNTQLVDWMINNGFDLYRYPFKDESMRKFPLQLAIENKDLNMVKYLVEQTEIVLVKERYKRGYNYYNPVEYAERMEADEIKEYLSSL